MVLFFAQQDWSCAEGVPAEGRNGARKTRNSGKPGSRECNLHTLECAQITMRHKYPIWELTPVITDLFTKEVYYQEASRGKVTEAELKGIIQKVKNSITDEKVTQKSIKFVNGKR